MLTNDISCSCYLYKNGFCVTAYAFKRQWSLHRINVCWMVQPENVKFKFGKWHCKTKARCHLSPAQTWSEKSSHMKIFMYASNLEVSWKWKVKLNKKVKKMKETCLFYIQKSKLVEPFVFMIMGRSTIIHECVLNWRGKGCTVGCHFPAPDAAFLWTNFCVGLFFVSLHQSGKKLGEN